MTPNSIDRANRLLELLSGKKPRHGDIDRMGAGADTFEDFRIRVVLSGLLGDAGADVVRSWREHANTRRTAPVANDLLQTLEHLQVRQRALELHLQEQDSAIRAKLVDIDAITRQLAGLQKQSRDVARMVTQYRAAIVRLGSLGANGP